LPRALPREVPHYHGRHASHYRALAATSQSPIARARLLREAEEHEKLAGAAAERGHAEKETR
jgi:hypothetical protein